ncbi:S41 family peptidase [Vagococcus humatus]|uniref:Peptidase S41 n=1 Tax=Vagococcus humatus TaxID=1889241 RepID=A0A429Z7K2_9ENTE|nr:S41 family peptidase [Vagococcus humatus]RST89677.1 peptidase S41 [Vagococcus humatus]
MTDDKPNKETRQISYKSHLIILISVMIICVGSTVAITRYVDMRQFTKSAYLGRDLKDDDLEKVKVTYDTILKNYVGKVDQTKLIDGAVKGMTSALDDPYSAYYSGQEAEDLDTTISGSFEGIGATMSLQNDMPVIVEPPIKGSPAEKARLRAKDTILKVDGKEVNGQPLNKIVSKIRGKKGTKVTLTIQRDSDIFDVTLVRDAIPIDSVFGEIDKKQTDVAHIRVATFSENTADEFKQTIQDMRKAGAKKLVIDLRQNPGGLLDQVAEMSSMFLKDGETIVKFSDKHQNKEKIVADKHLDHGFKVKEPTVVLVDHESASASEIFAAAVQQSADIPVIGTKTFGKGTVQSVQRLTESSELKLTTNKWLTPDGTWIHKKGLKPTIFVDYPYYAYLSPIDKSMSYQKGAEGNAVKTIHGALKALGYNVNQTQQVFTDETTQAVLAFQQDNQLPANGVVTKETASLLERKLMTLIQENDVIYNKGLDTLKK